MKDPLGKYSVYKLVIDFLAGKPEKHPSERKPVFYRPHTSLGGW